MLLREAQATWDPRNPHANRLSDCQTQVVDKPGHFFLAVLFRGLPADIGMFAEFFCAGSLGQVSLRTPKSRHLSLQTRSVCFPRIGSNAATRSVLVELCSPTQFVCDLEHVFLRPHGDLWLPGGRQTLGGSVIVRCWNHSNMFLSLRKTEASYPKSACAFDPLGAAPLAAFKSIQANTCSHCCHQRVVLWPDICTTCPAMGPQGVGPLQKLNDSHQTLV